MGVHRPETQPILASCAKVLTGQLRDLWSKANFKNADPKGRHSPNHAKAAVATTIPPVLESRRWSRRLRGWGLEG
jgi:hypothetical protein